MSAHPMTRRNALFTFVAAAVPQPGRAASGLLRATRVDHVALAVGDIDKAMLFYRRLFGNDVLKNVRTSRRYLHLGPCYLGIEPAVAGQPKRIDHVGIGIADFNPESTKKSLQQAGLKVREGAGLYVNDPGGISIQIWTDQSWTLNNAAPEPGPRQTLFTRAACITSPFRSPIWRGRFLSTGRFSARKCGCQQFPAANIYGRRDENRAVQPGARQACQSRSLQRIGR